MRNIKILKYFGFYYIEMLSNISITINCTGAVLLTERTAAIFTEKPTNLYLGLQVSGRMKRSYS